MQRNWIGVALILGLGICAIGEEKAVQEPAETPAAEASLDSIHVIPLKHSPAGSLAETVRHVLGTGERIVADHVSNSLIMSGSNDGVEKVRKLVAALERAPAMIRLEVVIGELPAETVADDSDDEEEKEDAESEEADKDDAKDDTETPAADPEAIREKMEVVTKVQLTALDNQPAMLQMTRNEPRIAVHAPGTPNIAMENAGLTLGITPRVSGESVTMEIDIKDSQLNSVEQFLGNVPVQTLDQLNLQTTLRIRDGETVLVGGVAQSAPSDKQRVILVTAHIVPAE